MLLLLTPHFSFCHTGIAFSVLRQRGTKSTLACSWYTARMRRFHFDFLCKRTSLPLTGVTPDQHYPAGSLLQIQLGTRAPSPTLNKGI